MTTTENSTADPKPMSRPVWARPNLIEVRSVANAVAGQYHATEAPASHGAFTGLMWAMGGRDATPVLKRDTERTLAAANAEIEAGAGIFGGQSYPAAGWWAALGGSPTLTPTLWRDLAADWWAREYSIGAATALAWMVGLEEHPSKMAPWYDASGRQFPAEVRQFMAAQLLRIEDPAGGGVNAL